jgi:hypothetical protein
MNESNKIIIAICRSPRCQLVEFFVRVCTIQDQISNTDRRIILIGDLNINIEEP